MGKSVVKATKMPTLSDFQKKVPKGGLLNPGLRKTSGLDVSKIQPQKKPKGDFANVGM